MTNRAKVQPRNPYAVVARLHKGAGRHKSKKRKLLDSTVRKETNNQEV